MNPTEFLWRFVPILQDDITIGYSLYYNKTYICKFPNGSMSSYEFEFMPLSKKVFTPEIVMQRVKTLIKYYINIVFSSNLDIVQAGLHRYELREHLNHHWNPSEQLYNNL